MKIHKFIIAGVFSTVLLLIDCGNSSEVDTVPGTCEDDKMVKGIIYNLEGAPVGGAIVSMRGKNTLADTAGILLKIKTSAIISTITDSKGEFVINSIKNGIYTIECSDGSNISIYETVQVEDPDLTVSLPPDTLKPAGAIKGVVRFAEEGDRAKSVVLAFGLDKFARVESDGYFMLMGLAEGVYDLRIISSNKSYRILDSTDIQVISGQTTSLGTLMLPFTGL